MILNRVMPCLLLMDDGLYKTIQFKKPSYIGDPINAVKIYNDKEVDELVFLDITATEKGNGPNLGLIKQIASECFMPLAYGGGITNIDQAKQIFEIGVEKVSLNTAAIHNPQLITDIANIYGSQSVIVSVDYKKNFWGKLEVMSARGKKGIKKNPIDFAQELESMGAGEILLTNIDREGTWKGYDIDTLLAVAEILSIPVIANGGAGSLQHLEEAIKRGNASAVGIGSMAVYQKKGMGVLINFPPRAILEKHLI